MQELVTRHGVTVREVPRDLLVVFGNTAGEMLAEFRSHQDPLVKQIADSYAAYRARSQTYMRQSYGAMFDGRALPNRWG